MAKDDLVKTSANAVTRRRHVFPCFSGEEVKANCHRKPSVKEGFSGAGVDIGVNVDTLLWRRGGAQLEDQNWGIA